jgi:hypothetical protein
VGLVSPANDDDIGLGAGVLVLGGGEVDRLETSVLPALAQVPRPVGPGNLHLADREVPEMLIDLSVEKLIPAETLARGHVCHLRVVAVGSLCWNADSKITTDNNRNAIYET